MWKCKNCNEEVEDHYEVCWNCGSDKKGKNAIDLEAEKLKDSDAQPVVFINTSMDENHRSTSSKKEMFKYPALKSLSLMLKILAVFIGLFGVMASLLSISNGKEGLLSSIGTFVLTIVLTIILYANAELIKVFIDIEYNTRMIVKQRDQE